MLSRFPVAFRPPAFASRVIRFPLGSWAFLAVGLPVTNLVPDPIGVPTFHTYEMQPGWVPPLPRGRRCSPDRMPCPAVACRFTAASPYAPLAHPIGGATHHEASTGVHAIHPSGLPLACSPRMGRGPSGFPLSFAPSCYQQRTSGAGPGVSTRPELRSRHHHRPSNPRVHSHRAASCRNGR
jgi:hypothetical protein